MFKWDMSNKGSENKIQMNPFTIFSFNKIPLLYTGIQCPTCDYKGMILTITDRSCKLDCETLIASLQSSIE